jgi:hypothetical protein
MIIQQLLADAGQSGASPELVSPGAHGLEAPADWSSLRTPESYTGYDRAENFQPRVLFGRMRSPRARGR